MRWTGAYNRARNRPSREKKKRETLTREGCLSSRRAERSSRDITHIDLHAVSANAHCFGTALLRPRIFSVPPRIKPWPGSRRDTNRWCRRRRTLPRAASRRESPPGPAADDDGDLVLFSCPFSLSVTLSLSPLSNLSHRLPYNSKDCRQPSGIIYYTGLSG